jgi:hypothetical protein
MQTPDKPNLDEAAPSARTPAESALDGETAQRMWDLIFGVFWSQAVRAMADLSLADHLSDCGLTAAEVARREGAAPDTTFRLMRAGVAIGLLTADPQGRFYSTPLLATLRKDDPQSLRGLAMAVTSRAQWLPAGELVSAVRSGQTQASAALGTDFYSYLDQNPPLASEFSAAMRSSTSLWGHQVAELIDTTNVQRVIDVGGATGTLIHLLQRANPELRGAVFDLPSVVADAEAEIARTGFPDRTEVIGGDFFESVPDGDLYLLKLILHNWNNEQCITILRCCQEAMAPGGRIAIIEMLIGELTDPGKQVTVLDLNMLALLPGQERSLEQFDRLLTAAGLRRTSVRNRIGSLSVIEAVAD